jgi:hypothetical protein
MSQSQEEIDKVILEIAKLIDGNSKLGLYVYENDKVVCNLSLYSDNPTLLKSLVGGYIRGHELKLQDPQTVLDLLRVCEPFLQEKKALASVMVRGILASKLHKLEEVRQCSKIIADLQGLTV